MNTNNNRQIRSTSSLFLMAFAMLVLTMSACGKDKDKGPDKGPATGFTSAPSSTSSSTPSPGSSSGKKIKFKDTDGNIAFSLKWKDDGAKLVDSGETKLARIKRKDNKVKVKAPDETVLAYITGDGKHKIKNADQSETLFVFQAQEDGDYKFKTGDDSLVYKIKKRDYGFEIKDAEGKELYKVKVKGDKVSLRDSSDKTIYSTKHGASPVAMACLGFDALALPVRIGLFYRVQEGLGK